MKKQVNIHCKLLYILLRWKIYPNIIKSYFYISEIGPHYFSLKGFQFFIQILSLFLGNKLYMLYILPRMENISILQTYYLFFISGIGPGTFHYRKVLFPHPNSPHLSWPPHTKGERYHLFLYTFYLFPTTRQTIVCPRTVCNAHSHYLF